MVNVYIQAYPLTGNSSYLTDAEELDHLKAQGCDKAQS